MNILQNTNLFSINQTAFEDILKIEVEKLFKQHWKAYEIKLAETYCFDDKLLSRKETAEKLNISIRVLDDRTSKGKIPSVSLGRGVKYRNSDILEYIKNLK